MGDDGIAWGGSGIEKVVYHWIRNHVQEGSTIVELGAGHVSTKALSRKYDLYSVEHNTRFLGYYDATYIHAEIDPATNWYERKILEKHLPRKDLQKLILIDGTNREGILNNLDLFNPEAYYLVHDTYRPAEVDLANQLGNVFNMPVTFHTDGDYWATI